ncbi:SixA phosphatase family protein [Pseudoponticoccus marisrubri]|uniref:Phosphoglycerate mutase n=1 Tax=Pseudoponticoccus marisrubri TaxID=1685382 RepID=A0A0W7WPG8_9RHOB|nr:histidine phosphatase family protein [Pseudoponticoccus marisrubri]KUF12494.1 phosphoglycerate mutase [Pseudoponticoccus marisrubri]
MKRLILMRHAKSDWSTGLDDHDRPLNARGRLSAAALGDWMRQTGHLPDEILCSTATRTRETLERSGVTAPVRYESSLYHAAPNTMFEVLSGASGAVVLMLGHNPGIAAFAHRMVAAAPDHPRFADYPTCATLVAEFEIDAWTDLTPGTGRAVDFVIPRELAG